MSVRGDQQDEAESGQRLVYSPRTYDPGGFDYFHINIIRKLVGA